MVHGEQKKTYQCIRWLAYIHPLSVCVIEKTKRPMEVLFVKQNESVHTVSVCVKSKAGSIPPSPSRHLKEQQVNACCPQEERKEEEAEMKTVQSIHRPFIVHHVCAR